MCANGPSDPVSTSSTANIDGGISEIEDYRAINVTSQAGRDIGLLLRWDSACWMWADADSVVDLPNRL